MDTQAAVGSNRTEVSGGRPDERFPELSVTRQHAGTEGVLLSVVASVNLTKGRGSIAFVHPVPNLQASGIATKSSVVVRTKGEDDAPLDEFPVTVKLNSELGPEDDRTGLVDVVLPIHTDVRAIELEIEGKVVDTFRVGGGPPAARAVHPVAWEGPDRRVAVEFERAMEDTHTYAVQVSADGGRTWQTIGVGLREPTFTLDRSQYPEGQEVQVRVITSNGLTSAVATSQPFRTPVGKPTSP